MKALRRFIAFNMTVLLAAALGIAFGPHLPFPVSYAGGSLAQDLSRVHILAITIAGMAIALLAQSALSLVGELRKLALWLGLAYTLIALMAFFDQVAFDGDRTGWLLIAVLFAIAAVFAWMGRRPLRPEEAAVELSTLKIPDEIRRGVLRQIEESAAQEERNRLARDLHDSIKQQLFSINVVTAAAQERWESDPEGARKALADVRRSAREAMVEMQAMLHQLRPEALSTAGLIEALREQCEALGYRTGAEVKLEIGEPVPDDRMPPGAQDALFRIGQEMLANVARHARAQHIRLWLGRQDEEVMLRIVDDGQGFDPAARGSGMGLRNLKERAASLRGGLEVASTPGSGTGLTVRIPLVSPLPAPAAVKQGVLSEFLSLSVAAGFLSYPLWTGLGAEGASEGFGDPSVTPWTFEVTGAARPARDQVGKNEPDDQIKGMAGGDLQCRRVGSVEGPGNGQADGQGDRQERQEPESGSLPPDAPNLTDPMDPDQGAGSEQESHGGQGPGLEGGGGREAGGEVKPPHADEQGEQDLEFTVYEAPDVSR